jgi:general secretion pathway protein B
MSYILDALQRADAERERVPGLKSQLVPPAGRDMARTSALRPWHAVAGLALALLVLGAWWWAGGDEAPMAASAPLAAQPEPVIVPAPAPAAPVTSPAPTIAAERPTPPQAVQPILAPPRPAPVPPAAPPAAGSDKQAPLAAKATTPPAAQPAADATPPTPASSAVPSFGELTADARAQLPPVNVSGTTYSQNPALRMLIANGKVVQEGQEIAPGLRLETIGPRNAVLNHRGLRYSIGY